MKESVMRIIVVYSILWIFFHQSISAQSGNDSITRRAPIAQIEQDTFFVKEILTITSKDIPSSCDYYLIILSDRNNYEYCVVSSYYRGRRNTIIVGESYYFLLCPQFEINSFPGTFYFEVINHKRIFKVASQMRFMNVYHSPNLKGLSYRKHSAKSRNKCSKCFSSKSLKKGIRVFD